MASSNLRRTSSKRLSRVEEAHREMCTAPSGCHDGARGRGCAHFPLGRYRTSLERHHIGIRTTMRLGHMGLKGGRAGRNQDVVEWRGK